MNKAQIKIDNTNVFPTEYDTGWIPLTLLNGWMNYSEKFTEVVNGEYSDAAYRCIGNIIYLQGLIVPPTSYHVYQPTMLSSTIPNKYLPNKSKLFRFDDSKEVRVTGVENGYTPLGISINGDFTDVIVDLSIISWPID